MKNANLIKYQMTENVKNESELAAWAYVFNWHKDVTLKTSKYGIFYGVCDIQKIGNGVNPKAAIKEYVIWDKTNKTAILIYFDGQADTEDRTNLKHYAYRQWDRLNAIREDDNGKEIF